MQVSSPRRSWRKRRPPGRPGCSRWSPAGATEENRRLLKHLRHEAPALLTFLCHEGVDATNYRAEQGIRPGVVNRKVWGGSRTNKGCSHPRTACSVLRTTAQQGGDAMAILGELIRSPVPMVARLNLPVLRLP